MFKICLGQFMVIMEVMGIMSPVSAAQPEQGVKIYQDNVKRHTHVLEERQHQVNEGVLRNARHELQFNQKWLALQLQIEQLRNSVPRTAMELARRNDQIRTLQLRQNALRRERILSDGLN